MYRTSKTYPKFRPKLRQTLCAHIQSGLRFALVAALVLVHLGMDALPKARSETLRLAVTTSFHHSGLSDVLLPAIRRDTKIDVHLLVVGTGQALKLGRAGDIDALLVHSKKAEEEFVAAGFGAYRREIMYNDFVIIGPQADPVGIRDAESAEAALQMLYRHNVVQQNGVEIFVSRGDDSGTHRRELELWAGAGLKPAQFSANWYRAAGAGMGSTLNVASGLGGYVLADRASWLNFGNKRELVLLYEGDSRLFNQYSYLPVNPVQHPHVRYGAAQRLENWLISETARALIAGYKIKGQRLFVPNAKADFE